MPEMICPQCKKPFRQGKHNQRFCNQQCKDDFHNAEKMAAYYERKLVQVEEAEERRANLREIIANRANGANGNGGERKPEPKPLREILQALKPETLPEPEQSFKRRDW